MAPSFAYIGVLLRLEPLGVGLGSFRGRRTRIPRRSPWVRLMPGRKDTRNPKTPSQSPPLFPKVQKSDEPYWSSLLEVAAHLKKLLRGVETVTV